MTVLITLTSAGTDTSTFDLYSNLDGFITPFETGITKVSLLAGYSSILVPDYTNVIKIQSLGGCVDYINVTLENTTTTTTSTSTTSTTTTTTTAAPIVCIDYTAGTYSSSAQAVTYTDCYGAVAGFSIGGVGGYDSETFCASEESVLHGSEVFLVENGACSTTTTTTTELM